MSMYSAILFVGGMFFLGFGAAAELYMIAAAGGLWIVLGVMTLPASTP